MTFELSKELHGFQYEVEAQTDIDKVQDFIFQRQKAEAVKKQEKQEEKFSILEAAVEAQTDIDKIQEKQEEKFYHAVWDIMDYARNEREVDKKTLVSYLKRHLAHAIRFDYEDN